MVSISIEEHYDTNTYFFYPNISRHNIYYSIYTNEDYPGLVRSHREQLHFPKESADE